MERQRNHQQRRASDTTHLTALGVILNTTGTGPLYGSGGTLGQFDGLNPTPTDVLLHYTYFGDANLDGKIDGSDYILLYPATKARLTESVQIQGHAIRWETIDLSRPWEQIELNLLEIPRAAIGI